MLFTYTFQKLCAFVSSKKQLIDELMADSSINSQSLARMFADFCCALVNQLRKCDIKAVPTSEIVHWNIVAGECQLLLIQNMDVMMLTPQQFLNARKVRGTFLARYIVVVLQVAVFITK